MAFLVGWSDLFYEIMRKGSCYQLCPNGERYITRFTGTIECLVFFGPFQRPGDIDGAAVTHVCELSVIGTKMRRGSFACDGPLQPLMFTSTTVSQYKVQHSLAATIGNANCFLAQVLPTFYPVSASVPLTHL